MMLMPVLTRIRMRKSGKKFKMSRLIYPSGGIYNHCSSNISGCSNHLSHAVSNSSLDIPEDFTYRSYLYSLGNTLNSYLQEINSINIKLKRTNDNFETLSNDLEDQAHKLITTSIKERNRMIV